jgi:hypothetical protein
VAHGFWLFTAHDRKQKMVLQYHSPTTQGVCDFGDDKKGKVLGTDIIKVNGHFTLNDVTLVYRLRYNLLSVSQFVDADLSVLFRKSDSQVLDSSGGLVCGVSRIGNIFQDDFSLAQSSLKCLLSQSSSKLWKRHRRLGHQSSTCYVDTVAYAYSEDCPCSCLKVTFFVLLVIIAR